MVALLVNKEELKVKVKLFLEEYWAKRVEVGERERGS